MTMWRSQNKRSAESVNNHLLTKKELSYAAARCSVHAGRGRRDRAGVWANGGVDRGDDHRIRDPVGHQLGSDVYSSGKRHRRSVVSLDDRKIGLTASAEVPVESSMGNESRGETPSSADLGKTAISCNK